jgi:hypothetical protein
MNKNQIRKLARTKILEGLTRQEVFSHLVKETEYDRDKLARVVQLIPSQTMRQKYKTAP